MGVERNLCSQTIAHRPEGANGIKTLTICQTTALGPCLRIFKDTCNILWLKCQVVWAIVILFRKIIKQRENIMGIVKIGVIQVFLTTKS